MSGARSVTLASSSLPAGGEKCINLPRSRDAASHPSFASRFKKALPVPPLKEGRRSADRRTTGFRPAAERKACQRMRRALRSPPPRIGAGLKKRRARLSALHRDYAPGVLSLNSAPGRASWNHRIQTGEPSPAPVQPAPGSPVTRRTVDAQNRPDAGLQARLREPHPPHRSAVTGRRPFDGRGPP